ncbi:hypothetical protein UCRPA7_2353 [Phaeoacremonium minimum UCRPA7]|uniref:Uncharacterized protein n=1 Tax=Phaeoacremonium minimum (strain UCR-PA7) TaxID=1286976 RepID=R8BS40_PHAM7|nr:hypothetical protein UCRPA7_2353 [Phaeoacremonium minimum UCRPA7]EOO02144.1 hypothetical protein UCRPA7_2353 [Phaeoacremonium minimum UCRPA7]
MFIRLSLAADLDGALDRVYVYLLYDLDCTVWGPGKGYIATGCKGQVLEDKRCNFNELINFIEFGTATNSPAYYELDNSFNFTVGTIAQIGDVLHQINIAWNEDTSADRIIKGRQTWTGLWNDFSYATKRTFDRAVESGLNIERDSANIKIALGELLNVRVAPLNSKIATHLAEQVREVKFRYIDRKNSFGQWTEIDWDETIRQNPALMDPKTDMYKLLTKTMKNYFTLPENTQALTVNTKAGQSLRPCYA